MSDKIDTRVIQVTNLAPTCTKEQLKTLFSYLGRVKELQMYPPETVDPSAVTVRVAYLEFEEVSTTGVSLHLNGSVFVDRALVIVPVMDGKIPDESTALRLTPQAVAGMLPGQPTWPANVVSQMTGTGINQVITTFDPKLTSLGLPQYPHLPASIDPNIIEEIRRTIYVSNLDSKVNGEMLITYFSQAGEVKFVRMAGDEAAYVEFTDQRSVAQALTHDKEMFQGRPLCIQHSKSQIIKPQDKESASPSRSKRSRSKSKARSRSRSKRRSRSRSKGRRRRSRSRSRKRSRSRHRSPRRSRSPRRRRSRSRGRVVPPAIPAARRSRSRDRRRSRSKSPVRKRRSRSTSRKRKSRTPPRSYTTKRSRSRSRKRSRSRSRKRSRSRDRKVKERKKSASLSPPRLERNGSIPPKDGSPARRDSSPKPEGPEEEKKESASAEESIKKAISKKRSPSPGASKSRRRSPSPRKRSRSRSPRRNKRRRRTRSPSPRKRSRSRSGSKHRSKRDRGKRSRSRDRKHDSKRKSTRDKDKDDKKKDSGSTKVKRDYDEEEKGYASGGSGEKAAGGEVSEDSGSGGESPPQLDTMEKHDIDHQTVDMDMSD